jgi:thioredoxin-related protein
VQVKQVNNLRALLLVIPFFLLSADQYSTKHRINWLTWEQAIALNEKEPKKLFVDLYTDWCGWCHKLDQTTFIDSHVVKAMNANYYAIKLNAETKDSIFYKNQFWVNPDPNRSRSIHPLAMALLQNKASFPTVVFLDEKQQIIQGIPGYLEAKDFYPIVTFFALKNYREVDFETHKNGISLYR